MAALTLIANPGSASRKYALYRDDHVVARLHFEYQEGRIICTGWFGDRYQPIPVDLHDLSDVSGQLLAVIKGHNLFGDNEQITAIGLRVVAPSSYFLQDRIMNEEATNRLRELQIRAPLHISATLRELNALRDIFPHATIVGVSDSAFHATKPDYAWNYGVRLQDADRFEIKRYGYHGISIASAVSALRAADKLPPRVIVAHLGSGASITAVHGGQSADTTMGYSPLEGLVMATRVGTIDPTAANLLQSELHLDDEQMEDYLNNHCGLLGLSGVSSSVYELLQHESDGHHNAHLALETYIYSIQKAIGSMAAAMGGVDMLVFTGTVGERSFPARQRIVERLGYLDFTIDPETNDNCDDPHGLTSVGRLTHSKPIYIAPADEAGEMVRRVQTTTNSNTK